LSRNPFLRGDGIQDPSGKIEVMVPYDGYHFFSWQSQNDVRKQLGRLRPEQPTTALVGHLAVASFGRTNLSEVLALRGNSSTAPLLVPVVGEGVQPDQLAGDRQTCKLEATYTIEEPNAWPLHVAAKVIDESAVLSDTGVFRAGKLRETLASLVSDITRQLNARHELTLQIEITVDLPSNPGSPHLEITATRLSIAWPTIPSPETVRLTMAGNQAMTSPVRYNPLARRLEWSQVPLQFRQTDTSAGLDTYGTQPMQLRIDQPSDLYAETPVARSMATADSPDEEVSSGDLLVGEAIVEIPGRLLSGLDVRLFSALGQLDQETPFNLLTRLRMRFRVFLDDLFERRILSPRHHLCFDQVIPDEMRWLDIQTALRDRGFRMDGDPIIAQGEGEIVYACAARRPQSPDALLLGLVARGKRHATVRQTIIPGGQRYTSTFESGELSVHIVAETPGNSHALIEEMNALQMALRERFDRVKANR
jgi:hypothetical protein